MDARTGDGRADGLMWGFLLHLGYNIYSDWESPDWKYEYVSYGPALRVDKSVWDDVVARMAESGLNTAVIELADGVRYHSHPEIAVEGAWSVEQLREELERMRKLGIEPIPKFNFSTAHDAWLKEYGRCVSTPRYYQVCGDLIAEAIEIFDHPRFVHLGMDEETAGHQRHHVHVMLRQYDLWWHDLGFLIEQVEKGGARAWVWADYMWDHRDEYIERMPRSVVQSNWYYEEELDPERVRVRAYLDLEDAGFDQVPTTANWPDPISSGSTLSSRNLENTVAFCREHIAPERLLGFLQTAWKPLVEAKREYHMEAIEQMARAIRAWESAGPKPLAR